MGWCDAGVAGEDNGTLSMVCNHIAYHQNLFPLN